MKYILSTLTIVFFGCKKESNQEKAIHRIEIRSSRFYVNLNNNIVRTPAVYYFKVGERLSMDVVGMYDGDLVTLTILKNDVEDKVFRELGGLKVVYEVQP